MLVNVFRRSIFVVGFLSLFIFGCSSDSAEPVELVEVHGKVFIDDAPVRAAKVFFVPEKRRSEQGYMISWGMTDAHGKFELQTADGRDGAIEGRHRVYISRIDDIHDVENSATGPTSADSTNGQKFAAVVDKPDNARLLWELVDESIEQAPGELIPFYYNLRTELECRVKTGIGIQRVEFNLSAVDPFLKSDPADQ